MEKLDLTDDNSFRHIKQMREQLRKRSQDLRASISSSVGIKSNKKSYLEIPGA